MILLKIKEKTSENTRSSFIFIYSIFLFSSAKITLALFLVLLSIPVISVAIC